MLAKYLVTGLIAATLAGGAVFMAADATEMHPHETVSKRESKKPDARKPKPMEGERRDAPATSKDAIDRMLGRDADKAKPARRYETTDTDEATTLIMRPEPKPEPKPKGDKAESEGTDGPGWLDSYMDADKDEHGSHMMDSAERENPERTPREAKMEESETRWLGHDSKHDTSKPDAKDRVDTKVMKWTDSAKGTFVITPGSKPKSDGKPKVETATTSGSPKEDVTFEDTPRFGLDGRKSMVRGDMSEPYAMLVSEAEKLEITDVKDGAYLNIVDYALMRGDYDEAKRLIAKLSTEELRDTARQNMGIALAQAGRMDAAFAVVDELEVEELADPIRLAIIQAATDRSRTFGQGMVRQPRMQR